MKTPLRFLLNRAIANAAPMTDAQRRAMFAKKDGSRIPSNPSQTMMKDGQPVMTIKEAQRRAALMKRMATAKSANEAEMAHHAMIQEQLRTRRPISSLDSAIPGLQMPRPIDSGGYGRTNFTPGVGNSPALDRVLRAFTAVMPPRIQTRPNPSAVQPQPAMRQNQIAYPTNPARMPVLWRPDLATGRR